MNALRSFADIYTFAFQEFYYFVLFSKNNAKSEMEDNGSGKGIKVPNTSHFQNGGSYSMLEALVGYFLFLSDIFLKSTILKV